MGFIYDLVHELDMLDIATEAIEDITEEVSANTDAMMGRDTGASTTARGSSSNDNDGELDPGTDDILGSTDDEYDNMSGSNDEPDNDEENDNPEDNMSQDESLDNQPDDASNDLGNEMPNNTNPVDLYRKRKIHAQYVALFETLETDISLIAEFIPRISNDATLHTLSNVNNNLTQCKEYVESILIDEFDKLEYHVLLKKYVALNRVYELCIKILEKYFDYKKNQK